MGELARSELSCDGVRSHFVVIAAVWLSFGSGCAGCAQSSLSVIQGPLNDPTNRTLRRDMLAFGLSQFCTEMVKHSAPLKLNEDQPVIGRFYPANCTSKQLPNGDIFMTFGGRGYAWTNLSKKISFTTDGQLVYDEDFLMDGSTMYAYFRTRQLQSSNFQTRVIESPAANFVNQLTPIGDNFGKQLVTTELQKGFTVIRESNGSADFGLGVIEKGGHPAHPFDVHGSSKLSYENTRVEVHQNQRDFIGPIVVEDSGRALYVTGTVDGIQAVDVLFMRKSEAEQSLDYYLNYGQVGPLAGAPFVSDVLQMRVPYTRTLPVPAGTYYMVIDNTPFAGQVAPPNNPLDDRAAVVSYVIQIGDAP